MKSCCHFCVDPTCGGKKNCNCEACSRKDSCYRRASLKPTIRITRRCTQACAHCCFECGPGIVDGDMTISVAENIRRFCQAHQIKRAEAMGGEFFTHPDWPQIFHILADKMRQVRLVTNGDWAGNARTASAVIGFLKLHPQFHVGVSKDRWHTNAHVDAAARMLQEAGIPFRLPTPDQIEEQSLVPVGRNRCEWTQFYGTFGCYCGPAERRYSFLIDELGRIYKCGFGSWPVRLGRRLPGWRLLRALQRIQHRILPGLRPELRGVPARGGARPQEAERRGPANCRKPDYVGFGGPGRRSQLWQGGPSKV